jgi:hypothetical protein
MYTVYKHISPSGKIYIGITSKEPKRRWNGGTGYLTNDYFTKAIKKYGWENFDHEIIANDLTKEEAELKEIELIAYYKSNVRKYGYNIQNGGSARGRHAEETKKKIGQANKGRKPWNYGKHYTVKNHGGHKLTEETKEKISKAHLGKKLSKEQIEKMANSNRGKKRTKEQCQNISNSLKGHKGVKHTQETKEKIARKLSKPIRLIETDTIYNSIREAGRKLNISSGNITECLKGRIKTAGGYHWEYVYK